MISRALILKRNELGEVAVHDAETGQILSAQTSVRLVQEPDNFTRVIVEFSAGGEPSSGLRLEFND